MDKVTKTKRIVAFVLAMAMVLTTAFCDTTTTYAAGNKAVKTVSLKIGSKKVTKKTYTLEAGKTATIKTAVSPSSAKKSVAYKSSKKTVATVSKTGKVTAKKAGTTKITVTVTGKNKKKKTTWVKIKVTAAKVKKVALNRKTLDLKEGESSTLIATVSPSNASSAISWSTSNSAVATVSKTGKVTAKKAGNAEITAKSNNGKTATCKVTVSAVGVTGITAKADSSTINVGASVNIAAIVTPSTATNKGVTYTSSNTAVAVVNAAGVVTGIGAGSATITVASVSNPGVKTSVVITVQSVPVTSITLDQTTAKLTITGTTNLTPTVFPANATNSGVVWSSSNESVAEVSANGVVTGKTVGTATITATAADGSGVSASCEVTVRSDSKIAGAVTIEVTNPYTDGAGNKYEKTVLVGDDMSIRVRVLNEDSQPLGNSNVTLTMTPVYGNSASYFEVRNSYLTTDENGYANFTIGLKSAWADVNAVSNRFQSYTITATEASSNVKATETVKFASISVSNLWNENGFVGDPIDPSDNASAADDGLALTSSVNGAKIEEYVTSQKVSAADGTDDNTVYFDVAPYLVLPATSENAHIGDWEVDFTAEEGTSGSYSVYNDENNLTTTTTVQEVPAGLQYITVYLSRLNLSKYSALYIDLYSADSNNYGQLLAHEERTYTTNDDGSTGGIGIQISAQKDHKSFIVVSIVSQGQVDASNTGYVLTKMTGPWATTNDELTTLVELSGCVTWKDVSENLIYDTFTWSYAEAAKYLPVGSEFLNPNYTYTYKVPSFPYNGNAIITIKDANGTVKAYYTYPTVRDETVGNENVNILAPAPTSTLTGEYAVLVSSEEVSQRNVATLTQSGNFAAVSATKTGITELKATVSVAGLDSTELNELNGGILYTSVQWAPIPTKTETEVIPDYFAVEGQTVTVIAQLYDMNGNKKSDPGTAMNFYYTDTNGEQKAITAGGQEIGGDADGNNTVTVVQYTNSTDAEGQIVITLTGNGIDYVEGIGANATGYKVGLTFDGSKPGATLTNTNGNVYWVDLGVTYVDSAVLTDNPTRSSQFENAQTAIAKEAASEAGKTWHIGYIPVARSHKFDFSHTLVENGNISMHQWPSEFISVSGINLNYSVGRSSKATLTDLGNNVVSLYSKVTGATVLTGTIDPESVTADTTFVFYDENMNKMVYPNVGTGTPIVANTGLNLTMNWTLSGMKASILTPAGTTLDKDTDSVVYVEVLDIYDNKAQDKSVKYTITGPNATAAEVTGQTDEFGIFAIALPAPGTNGISVISVVVGDDIRDSVSITYNDSGADAFGLDLDDATNNEYAVEVTGNRELTVYFNNQINKGTIQAGEFTFAEDNNDTVTYTVVSAVQENYNNSVVLTLDQDIVNPGAQHTLSIGAWTATNGVVYEILDNNGQKISAAADVNQGSSYTFKPSERTVE